MGYKQSKCSDNYGVEKHFKNNKYCLTSLRKGQVLGIVVKGYCHLSDQHNEVALLIKANKVETVKNHNITIKINNIYN